MGCRTGCLPDGPRRPAGDHATELPHIAPVGGRAGRRRRRRLRQFKHVLAYSCSGDSPWGLRLCNPRLSAGGCSCVTATRLPRAVGSGGGRLRGRYREDAAASAADLEVAAPENAGAAAAGGALYFRVRPIGASSEQNPR